jgi:hypothetical protein
MLLVAGYIPRKRAAVGISGRSACVTSHISSVLIISAPHPAEPGLLDSRNIELFLESRSRESDFN